MLKENTAYEIREFLRNERVLVEAREITKEGIPHVVYYTNVQIPDVHPSLGFPFMREVPVMVEGDSVDQAFLNYDKSVNDFASAYMEALRESSKPKLQIATGTEQLLLKSGKK